MLKYYKPKDAYMRIYTLYYKSSDKKKLCIVPCLAKMKITLF